MKEKRKIDFFNMNRASGSSSSRFDVFLSFRGEDTRSNFTSHLNMALRQKGINVFVDNKLSRGEEISASLLEAIEQSNISIVIISEKYASSSWCLNELVKIIMCNTLSGQIILPVFYKVDPSQVRKQSGTFGEEFAKLEVRFFNKMQAWREALTTVSHMSGWPLLQNHDEADLIQKIVQEVWKKLNRATMQLHVAKYPVGIDMQLMNLLSHVMNIDGTRMVGLYGIGGMGKTTLAKALYNRIADDFEACCFLANIREASNQYGGLVQLQEKLLSEILMDDFIRVSNLHRGINIIRNRLCTKRILLILDDVDTLEQLQALAGGHDWFGFGSKIIATTRNKHLLVVHGFDISQNVSGLNYDEALELFSWHAFKNSHPPSDYLDLSKRAERYCKGLPLAIEVLGSFLYSTDQSKFKRILDEYENSYLDKDIQVLLQISYDGLENDVKEIFLFISCFVVGEDITKVKTMLEACGCLCLEKGITKLMNLSLLTINGRNKVGMHDLIQQMGRTIARTLSDTSKSLKRKRLLIDDDAMDVLNGNKEARAVKAMKLDFRQPTELDIDSRAFEKVKNLVVLKVENATSSKSLDFLPSSLRWFNWSKFPFSSLPSSYSMENLIELKLPYSSIKHFGKGFMGCERLKKLDLSNSDLLEEIPDLSSAINLEELVLYNCNNLVKVHESVGSLSKLVEFRISSHVNGFKQFPSQLKLKSLKKFVLSRGTTLGSYPQFSGEMKSSLELLGFQFSSVIELSPTIGYLTGLKHLFLVGCTELTTFPTTIYRLSNLTNLAVEYSDLSTFPSLYPCSLSLFPYLNSLRLRQCKITNLDFLETIACAAPALCHLNLSGNYFSSIPSCIINFKSLRFLDISYCELLEEIPKVPEGVTSMTALQCISLAKFPDNIADFISCDIDREYHEGVKTLILMNCDIPEWYIYKSMKNPITFFLPSDYPCWNWKAFAPCIKFQVNNKIAYEGTIWLGCKVLINDIQVWSSYRPHSFLTEWRRKITKPSTYEYMLLIVLHPCLDFQPYWDDIKSSFGINSSASLWNKFTVLFEVRVKETKVRVKRCGVHVIMEE